ncbi:cytochrome P450 [Aspergillus californicus]
MEHIFLVGNWPSFFVVLAVVYILTLTYRAHKNPISSVPGPWYSKYTNIVNKYHFVRGQRPRYVHGLHLKYGPIVRITPTEVDVSCISSAREIHRIASPYRKSPWYRLLTRKDGENMFSTTDPEYHRRHRRLLSSPLSDQNLRNVMEPLVRSRVQLAITRMGAEARSARGVMDICKWFFFMATDIIGELSFGDSFDMLEVGERNQYVHDLEKVAKIGGIRATFPVTMAVASVLPLGIFREVVASTDRIMSYATESVERYRASLLRDPENPRPSLFMKLFAAGERGEKGAKSLQGGEECLSDREIRNDAQAFIVAGSDTTANTLTYLVWAVLRHPEVKERLVAELQALSASEEEDGSEELSDTHLRDLPYLHQVINETLRLYPVVPSGLPRIVPESGSTLAGYFLPGGATVTTQLYTIHKDPDVFEDPEVFNPSRWENPTREMRDAFMPFSAGSRNCVGLHLAKMELRLATALFFDTFPGAKVSTKEDMSDEDMEEALYFLLSPKGKRCLVEV